MLPPISSEQPRHGSSEEAAPDLRQIQDEQLRMIWSHARAGVLIATAFAIVLALALRHTNAAADRVIDSWMLLKLLSASGRVMLGMAYSRGTRPDWPWRELTLWPLVIDGLLFGVAGCYLTLSGSWELASFVSAALACIACVATFGLQVNARFTAGYAGPILTLTAVGMMLRGELFGEIGGLGLLMLLGLQGHTAMQSERRMIEGLRLRLKAERLAQEKDEALRTAMRQSAVKTQFLANISHELRTPLHGILGMTKLLHLSTSQPVARRRLELIESTGTHLLGLINDLLDISRLDAGQFRIHAEPFDLHAQLEQLVGIYAVRIEEKGLGFEVHHNLPTPCWVQGDPARCRQVMHNLMGNAVKFTREGHIRLQVARDADSGQVRMEVHDTGVGMSPAELACVFQAFQRGGSARQQVTQEGTGLGLTIARDIARAMGGDIEARSCPGQGTTMAFTVRLPAAAACHETSATPQATEPTAPPLQAVDVLLAEDNNVNALVAMNFLEILGVQAERVKDGRAAVVQALREGKRPDIVLMDCHMPELNGFEATREIRAQEQALRLTPIPIVALTATTSDAAYQDCLAAGMNDVLTKPCTLDDLERAILRWTGTDLSPQIDQASANADDLAVATAGSASLSLQT
jgi:signal transduction histidine kinase/CheY-like chemotaxis protein